MASLATGSMASLATSSTSSIHSPNTNNLSFDHESLFRDVDNELEQDYEKLEQKKKLKTPTRPQRPTTPTYRAQMQIIQLKVFPYFFILTVWK